MIKHPRQTLLSDTGFDVDLTAYEIEPGVLMHFVHLDVYEWSASALKRLLRIWPQLRATLPPIVFCHGHTDDEKFHRFVSLFGWQQIHYTPCSDGVTRRIYVHYHYGDTHGRRT